MSARLAAGSEHSLYSEAHVTFEDDAGAYDQKDAAGFIQLNALRLKLLAARDKRLKVKNKKGPGQSIISPGLFFNLKTVYSAVMTVITNLPSGLTGPSSFAPKVYSKATGFHAALF